MPVPLTNYKTPGVYVQEIRKLPPSIAQVETAIPVFIGYTQIAEKETAKDLQNVPTSISSLAEYEQYFGQTNAEDLELSINTISSSGRRIVKVDLKSDPKYRMYYAVQMFYLNGGGQCFVISVGDLTDQIELQRLQDAIGLLQEYTDPTLLLFPDAVDGLTDGDYRTLLQSALLHCDHEKINNSFVVMDVKQVGGHKADVRQDAENFRALSGPLNLLKYGAAYYPYLETVIPYEIQHSKIVVIEDKVDGLTAAEAATRLQVIYDGLPQDDPNRDKVKEQLDLATAKKDAEAEIEAEKGKIDPIKLEIKQLELKQEAVLDIARILQQAINAGQSGKEARDAVLAVVPATLVDIRNAINGVDLDDGAGNEKGIAEVVGEITAAVAAVVIQNGNDLRTQIAAKELELDQAKTAAIEVIKKSAQKKAFKHATLEQIAEADNGLFNILSNAIAAKARVIMPPSSTMAGVYARVDNSEGVHQSPANIGPIGVVQPHRVISDEIHDGLNVDTNAGKSINVIRSFKGRGPLVWGARTLAGNDREWRYVSVRRFFNMVEESVKRALLGFVFAPNNPNTWASIRSAIGGFLNTQWRAGALLGNTAADSYFVNVGVPETFSETEMLDGYLVVEIGMAVVRPAEFIILKFSHKFDLA